MKIPIFLLFYICKCVFTCNVCPGPIQAPNGVFERDAAAAFPDDEVILSDDDNRKFIPYKYVADKRVNDIKNCAAYTCGRKTFPHGFNIEIISHKPLMLCEEHRCLNPDKIKCRKTVEHGACARDDEWVAGFIERKNETKEWLEVECCHYEESIDPAFIKVMVISSQYTHDIVLENGTMIASDYIKDIKKAVDILGQTVYSASIYRMKCDTKNIPEKVPSIFDSVETLKDEDGTGFFDNATKTCEKDTDFHVLFLNNFHKVPTLTCFFEKCLNFDKIECKKNVEAKKCASKNQWIAGFSKFENGTWNVLNVECCEYKDLINSIFHEYVTFNATNITTNYVIEEFGLPVYAPFVNNITVIGEKNGTTIYSASVSHVSCNGDQGMTSIMQEHQERSLKTMMSDTLRRAFETAYRNSTKDLPPEYLPLLKSQQESMVSMFGQLFSKASEIQTKNSTEMFKEQEEILRQQSNLTAAAVKTSLSNHLDFAEKSFPDFRKSNVSLLDFLI